MARPSAARHRFTARNADDGRRLDQVLAANVPGLSRQKARVLLDIGGVFVDGARVKVASRAVRAGQSIEAHVGGALARAEKAVGRAARARDEAELPEPRIVFHDDDLVVADKPARLITAPTPESDRNNLADLLRRRLGGDIYVVQRLDLGTSGLLVLARNARANRALSDRIRVHDFDRTYLAVLRGTLAMNAITIDEPVEGKRARTKIEVLERLGESATLVRCHLETGRTHQIRLHARHLGHPVLGDRLYGEPTTFDPPRLALHAARLGFVHPRGGPRLAFDSPLPDDLASWLSALRARLALSPNPRIRR